MASSPTLHFFFFLSQLFLIHHLHAQQAYVDNKQMACYQNDSTTWGYTCNGPRSCSAYLIFRSLPPYVSAVTISYLLNAQPSDVARINEVTDLGTIPTDTQVIVPVNCSCSGAFYQHNANYAKRSSSETYFTISNLTYQGLTTCQAMMNQNPYDSRNLTDVWQLLAPLRCACPTRNQSESGVRFLLTYLIAPGDASSIIAERFGVEEKSLLDANELSPTSTIYPFNSLLVPLTTEPTKDMVVVAASPPSSEPPQPELVPTTRRKTKSKKWVSVGIGIGAACLLLLIAFGVLFWFIRRKHRKPRPVPIRPGKRPEQSNDYVGLPSRQSDSFSAEGLRQVLDSLTVYKFEELQKATGWFNEDSRIEGSVFKGVINGDHAAIKRVGGNVSNEINALKKISHSSVIRLSGFCLHEGCTYLVYEFADQGSLHDWLHGKKHQSSDCLNWKQRVQIAYDVADGLNYLHNYASPTYIHKDLKSSNILLDGNLRAKVANFGLARAVESEGGLQLTRNVVGTQGYLAPEYLEHGLITPKLDVYAYGVVLLELLSGREALSSSGGDNKEVKLLTESIKHILAGENVRQKLREFVDPDLHTDYPLDMAFTLAKLARTCIDPDANQRPTMGEVFLSVSKIHSISLDWESSEEQRSNSAVHGR